MFRDKINLSFNICCFLSVGLRTRNTFLHIYSCYHIEEKSFSKALREKVKLLRMSNFTFFHNAFHAICILKSFNSHISVVVSASFNLGWSQNGVLGNGIIKQTSPSFNNPMSKAIEKHNGKGRKCW